MRKYTKRSYLVLFSIILVLFVIISLPVMYSEVFSKYPVVVDFDWNINVSRNLFFYVQPDVNTTVLAPVDLCNTHVRILVVVCSSPQNFNQREAIRQTWGGATKTQNNVAVVFLMGISGNSSVQDRILEESVTYGDVIQERFHDSYNNLTVKTVMMLKWMTFSCPHVEYLLKADDDIFINTKALTILLARKSPGNLLMGNLILKAKPIRDPRDKWYTPEHMFSEDVYPTYLSGSAYVMTNDVAYRLYEGSFGVRLFHLEDVFLTGIVATQADVKRTNSKAFTFTKIRRDPCLFRSNKMVAFWHRITVEEMTVMWSIVNNGQIQCK